MRACDASLSSAIILPFVKDAQGQWRVDRLIAKPALVPGLSLGREVDVVEQAPDKYTFSEPKEAGGNLLRSICLDETMFRADEMLSVNTDLIDMRVWELKQELECRGESCSGSKAMLQRRLHASIVREQLLQRDEEDDV